MVASERYHTVKAKKNQKQTLTQDSQKQMFHLDQHAIVSKSYVDLRQQDSPI